MFSLGRYQRDLIFDYCLGLCHPVDVPQAEELIVGNAQAAELHDRIRAALAPLSYMPAELCPNELADRTLQRLRELSGHHRAPEPSGPVVVKLGFGRYMSNATGVVVTAASLLLMVGVLMRISSVMRQRSYSQMCGGQLSEIYRAMNLYSADHDGVLPAVARTDGTFWHAIGDQGAEGGANTRNPFLLLKLGYLERPADFLCCGKIRKGAAPLTPAQTAAYSDFPSRDYITYSYRLMPAFRVRMASLGARPLMADMNPHFERPAAASAGAFRPRSDGAALRLNSGNHGRRGQNVLCGDGHVRYSRTRFLGDSDDDIYTMDGGDVGDGCRFPTRLDDAFLAP